MPNKPSYEDDGWADAMAEAAQQNYLLDRKVMLQHPESNIRCGSLWTSKSTGRRGLLRWVADTSGRCCLVFNDGQGRHEMTLEQLRRLYTPVM